MPALYRGFLPNALKNLPNKGTCDDVAVCTATLYPIGIRLSTFEAAKKLMAGSEAAYEDATRQYKALKTTPVTT